MWFMKDMDWGIYRGIEKIEVERIAKDYICIEYKGEIGRAHV